MAANTVNNAMHRDLLAGVQAPRGLILFASPTGQGKTTAIEQVFADPACPPEVVFMGDLGGDLNAAQRAVSLARSQVVVAVLRTHRAAGAFLRLIDMGAGSPAVAEVARMAFSTRLFRPSDDEAGTDFLLLHERLVVTDAIRALIVAGADPHPIHRLAIAEGMRSLRQLGLEQVRAGRLSADVVAAMTPED
jgi:type II secretory ATPase GspE/PulE/Tfp pilus assembly ATPase PilB-like protein